MRGTRSVRQLLPGIEAQHLHTQRHPPPAPSSRPSAPKAKSQLRRKTRRCAACADSTAVRTEQGRLPAHPSAAPRIRRQARQAALLVYLSEILLTGTCKARLFNLIDSGAVVRCMVYETGSCKQNRKIAFPTGMGRWTEGDVLHNDLVKVPRAPNAYPGALCEGEHAGDFRCAHSHNHTPQRKPSLPAH